MVEGEGEAELLSSSAEHAGWASGARGALRLLASSSDSKADSPRESTSGVDCWESARGWAFAVAPTAVQRRLCWHQWFCCERRAAPYRSAQATAGAALDHMLFRAANWYDAEARAAALCGSMSGLLQSNAHRVEDSREGSVLLCQGKESGKATQKYD